MVNHLSRWKKNINWSVPPSPGEFRSDVDKKDDILGVWPPMENTMIVGRSEEPDQKHRNRLLEHSIQNENKHKNNHNANRNPKQIKTCKPIQDSDILQLVHNIGRNHNISGKMIFTDPVCNQDYAVTLSSKVMLEKNTNKVKKTGDRVQENLAEPHEKSKFDSNRNASNDAKDTFSKKGTLTFLDQVRKRCFLPFSSTSPTEASSCEQNRNNMYARGLSHLLKFSNMFHDNEEYKIVADKVEIKPGGTEVKERTGTTKNKNNKQESKCPNCFLAGGDGEQPDFRPPVDINPVSVQYDNDINRIKKMTVLEKTCGMSFERRQSHSHDNETNPPLSYITRCKNFWQKTPLTLATSKEGTKNAQSLVPNCDKDSDNSHRDSIQSDVTPTMNSPNEGERPSGQNANNCEMNLMSPKNTGTIPDQRNVTKPRACLQQGDAAMPGLCPQQYDAGIPRTTLHQGDAAMPVACLRKCPMTTKERLSRSPRIQNMIKTLCQPLPSKYSCPNSTDSSSFLDELNLLDPTIRTYDHDDDDDDVPAKLNRIESIQRNNCLNINVAHPNNGKGTVMNAPIQKRNNLNFRRRCIQDFMDTLSEENSSKTSSCKENKCEQSFQSELNQIENVKCEHPGDKTRLVSVESIICKMKTKEKKKTCIKSLIETLCKGKEQVSCEHDPNESEPSTNTSVLDEITKSFQSAFLDKSVKRSMECYPMEKMVQCLIPAVQCRHDETRIISLDLQSVREHLKSQKQCKLHAAKKENVETCMDKIEHCLKNFPPLNKKQIENILVKANAATRQSFLCIPLDCEEYYEIVYTDSKQAAEVVPLNLKKLCRKESLRKTLAKETEKGSQVYSCKKKKKRTIECHKTSPKKEVIEDCKTSPKKRGTRCCENSPNKRAAECCQTSPKKRATGCCKTSPKKQVGECCHTSSKKRACQCCKKSPMKQATECCRTSPQKRATECCRTSPQKRATECCRTSPQKRATECCRTSPQKRATECYRTSPQKRATECYRTSPQKRATDCCKALSKDKATDYSKTSPKKKTVESCKMPSNTIICNVPNTDKNTRKGTKSCGKSNPKHQIKKTLKPTKATYCSKINPMNTNKIQIKTGRNCNKNQCCTENLLINYASSSSSRNARINNLIKYCIQMESKIANGEYVSEGPCDLEIDQENKGKQVKQDIQNQAKLQKRYCHDTENDLQKVNCKKQNEDRHSCNQNNKQKPSQIQEPQRNKRRQSYEQRKKNSQQQDKNMIQVQRDTCVQDNEDCLQRQQPYNSHVNQKAYHQEVPNEKQSQQCQQSEQDVTLELHKEQMKWYQDFVKNYKQIELSEPQKPSQQPPKYTYNCNRQTLCLQQQQEQKHQLPCKSKGSNEKIKIMVCKKCFDSEGINSLPAKLKQLKLSMNHRKNNKDGSKKENCLICNDRQSNPTRENIPSGESEREIDNFEYSNNSNGLARVQSGPKQPEQEEHKNRTDRENVVEREEHDVNCSDDFFHSDSSSGMSFEPEDGAGGDFTIMNNNVSYKYNVFSGKLLDQEVNSLNKLFRS